MTNYCIKCGAGHCEILDGVRSEECTDAPNVIGMSHRMSARQMHEMAAIVARVLWHGA